MQERKDSQKTWLAIAFLVAVFVIAVIVMQGCPQKADAYRGIFGAATTDSVDIVGVAHDTTGIMSVAPSAFKCWVYKEGTLCDSTTNYWWGIPVTGIYRTRVAAAKSGAGAYSAIVRVTMQTYLLGASDSWTAGGVTLTTAERAAVALAAADSTILYRIGAALDSGVYDTTLGGRIYDFDVANATGTWAAITQADCDTVKMGGLPLADCAVLVTLTADYSTPVYWGRTDANGCFTVYVRKGATYAVRPVYQGSWMASWCTVAK